MRNLDTTALTTLTALVGDPHPATLHIGQGKCIVRVVLVVVGDIELCGRPTVVNGNIRPRKASISPIIVTTFAFPPGELLVLCLSVLIHQHEYIAVSEVYTGAT